MTRVEANLAGSVTLTCRVKQLANAVQRTATATRNAVCGGKSSSDHLYNTRTGTLTPTVPVTVGHVICTKRWQVIMKETGLVPVTRPTCNIFTSDDKHDRNG